MSLREMMYYTLAHGDLAQNPREETGADRLGALARSDPLGAALWRIVGSHDVVAFRKAITLLAARLHNPESSTTRAIARRAIEEWLICICDTCNGRKFVTDDKGVRSTCHVCHGSGRGRTSDDERIRAMHLSRRQYAHLTTEFDAAHTALTKADSRCGRQVAYQLEHRKPLKKKTVSK